MKLYMLMLGCRPAGRLTEQHDVFFGIADSLKALVPHIKASWPEAKGNIHIDAWREVTQAGNYKVSVQERNGETETGGNRLFFLNLGGYKPGEFDEFHYKLLIAAESTSAAIKEAKASAFYQHTGFKGAVSHIDDKYGVDVDEVYDIAEILPAEFKERYTLVLEPQDETAETDEIHLGFLQLWKIVH